MSKYSTILKLLKVIRKYISEYINLSEYIFREKLVAKWYALSDDFSLRISSFEALEKLNITIK